MVISYLQLEVLTTQFWENKTQVVERSLGAPLSIPLFSERGTSYETLILSAGRVEVGPFLLPAQATEETGFCGKTSFRLWFQNVDTEMETI